MVGICYLLSRIDLCKFFFPTKPFMTSYLARYLHGIQGNPTLRKVPIRYLKNGERWYFVEPFNCFCVRLVAELSSITNVQCLVLQI